MMVMKTLNSLLIWKNNLKFSLITTYSCI